jgi:hypothetical protein
MMDQLVNAHLPLWAVVLLFVVTHGAYYIFSAYVGSREMPGPNSTKEERERFRFLNQLAANFDRAAASAKIPAADIKRNVE